MKKFFGFLASTQLKAMLVKAGVFLGLVFGAMFWLPLVFVTIALVCAIIIFERNFKSVYYVVFLIPFDAAFYLYLSPAYNTFPVIYAFFIVFHFVLYICKARISIFKDKVFILILVVSAYIIFSPLVFGFSIFWSSLTGTATRIIGVLFFLYLAIRNREQLVLKDFSIFVVSGILISAVFGLFIRLGDRGQDIMSWDYIHIGQRYFGLINANPNVFHMIILAAIFCLFALSIKKQINFKKVLPSLIVLGAFLALSVLGVLTKSLTFYIAYAMIVLAFVIIKIISKENTKKQKLIFLGLFLLAIIVTSAIAHQQIIETFERLMSLDTSTNLDGEHTHDPGRIGLMLRHLRGWYHSFLTFVFGNGMGNSYQDIYNLPSYSPHNMYVFLLWGGGIIGFGLVLSTLICLFITATKTSFRKNLGIIIMFVACFAIVTMTETFIITPAFPIAFISFFLFVSNADDSRSVK